MKRFTLGLGVVVAGLALTASPALAQRPSESGSASSGARSTGGGGGNSGGGGGGTAVSRSAPASVSAPSSNTSSPTTSSPSAGSAMAPSMRGASAAAPRQAGPEHRTTGWPASSMPSRSAGAQHMTTGNAVPRSESAATVGSGARTPNNPNGADSRAVPSWARSRGNNPAVDTAVPRTSPRLQPGNGGTFVYLGPGFSYCYVCGVNGFYDYYDPFYGSIYPPMFGYGMGLGLGGYPTFDPSFGYSSGDPYDYGVGSYSTSQYASHEEGNLKLKVKPRSAKVYVDGYYVGIVDEFDGAFQKLPITAGRHHVKIEADGYESVEFDAVVTANQTVTFQGTLKKIQ